MQAQINSIITIIVFGALILLSYLKITNPLEVNKKANFWFGIFLFLWSTFWMDNILNFESIGINNTIFKAVIRFLQFLTPVPFYFSVMYFTTPDFKVQKGMGKYLLLPAAFLILLLLRYTRFSADPHFIEIALIVLVFVQAIFYTAVSYFKIRRHQKRILLYASNTVEINLNWLEYIILLIFLMSIFSCVYSLVFNPNSLDLIVNGIFLVAVFIIAYYSLKQKEIFPADEKERSEIISIEADEELPANKKKIVADNELANLKQQLSHLIQEQKPYMDSELNLIKLSELMNITAHQLSYVINTGFSENFFQYINKFRVQKAKELLINDKMNNLTILGIAYESGFNSKTSFNTTFKKITGKTPSEFKKTCTNL